MTPVWIAFAVGACIIGAPLGFMLAAALAKRARGDVAREAYRKGRMDALKSIEMTERDGMRWDVRIPEPLS